MQDTQANFRNTRIEEIQACWKEDGARILLLLLATSALCVWYFAPADVEAKCSWMLIFIIGIIPVGMLGERIGQWFARQFSGVYALRHPR